MRFFRADAAFAVPELYKTPGAEGCSCAIRPGKTAVPESRIAPVLKRPAGRPPTHVRRICGDFAYQAASRGKPSWDKPSGSSPGSNGIRVTCSRRSALWPPTRRWSRTGSFGSTTNAAPPNSMSRKEGRRSQSDASFLQGHGAERGAASASCIGLQSRCLPAGHRPAGGDGRPVADRPADLPHQDRSAGRPPRPSHHVPTGRGGCRRRSVHPHPCGHPTAPCAPGTGQTDFRFKPVAIAINSARFTNRMPEP